MPSLKPGDVLFISANTYHTGTGVPATGDAYTLFGYIDRVMNIKLDDSKGHVGAFLSDKEMPDTYYASIVHTKGSKQFTDPVRRNLTGV